MISQGAVKIDGECYTVLLAPMKGFYRNHDIGKTQVRLALVENSELLKCKVYNFLGVCY